MSIWVFLLLRIVYLNIIINIWNCSISFIVDMNTAYYVKREKIDFVVFFLLIKVLLLTGTLRWSIGAQQAPLSSHFFVKVVLSKFEFNLPTLVCYHLVSSSPPSQTGLSPDCRETPPDLTLKYCKVTNVKPFCCHGFTLHQNLCNLQCRWISAHGAKSV